MLYCHITIADNCYMTIVIYMTIVVYPLIIFHGFSREQSNIQVAPKLTQKRIMKHI